MFPLVLLVLCAAPSRGVLYDTYSGRPVTGAEPAGRPSFCSIDVAPCNPQEPRRLDGSCNNLQRPSRGATLTPYIRLLPPRFGRDYGPPPSSSGAPLPNARQLRVALTSDGRESSHQHTQLVTHALVALTAEVTSQHDTVNYVLVTRHCCTPAGRVDPGCFPIDVPDDDLHLRRSNVRCLNLTRSITYQRLGCVPVTLPPARINTSPPLLDLSLVYGNSERAAQSGRSRSGGELRAERRDGRDWPPTGAPFCINNEANETRCHNAPNPMAANSVLGVNLIFLWHYRLHNAIARRLAALNPCWDDEQLFRTARDINIAFYQHATYHQLFASLLGEKWMSQQGVLFLNAGDSYIDDYSPSLELGVSLEYIMSSRWFHTMQEGRLGLWDERGNRLRDGAVVDYTLRTGALAVDNGTLAAIGRGALRQPCAAPDALVDPEVGERILGRLQFASDVSASDIMKGRDTGLPPYKEYLRLCGLPEPTTFRQLLHYMTPQAVEALEQLYDTVDDVELVPALLAEGAAAGARGEGHRGGNILGPTLTCLVTEQLRRWRQSDRFWYENSQHPEHFTPDQLRALRSGASGARLVCDHAEGVAYSQRNPYLLPGPGNEVVPCSEIPDLDLTPWRDDGCDSTSSPRNFGGGAKFTSK